MNMRKTSSNFYFTMYTIFDENGKRLGMIEDHNVGVKKRYFIGWKIIGENRWETKPCYTLEAATMYSVGKVVKLD